MSAEKQNDYALKINGERLHISQAESGKRGYYCPACNQEMVAHKSKIIRSHFKHDFRDVERKGKCTFSNEEYRKQIAKEALQILKSIKVPNLYKYSPQGNDGKPNLLKKAEILRAKTVEIDLKFYEDENGVIQWGHSPINDKQELIIKPEATFLDSKGIPILLIEMVSNFKRDIDHLTKLKRVAIDTVWTKIPKGTEEEIHASFKSSKTTKWAYNNEEQKTEYLPIPGRNQDFVYEADDDQERLFEENFECRSSEIGNVIRAIRRCLASEQYRNLEGKFGSEISRTERIAHGESIELQSIRRAIRERLDDSVRDRRGAIADRRRKLGEKTKNLEERYYRKRDKLEEESRNLRTKEQLAEREVRETIEGLGGGSESFKAKGDDLERRIQHIKEDQETERAGRDEAGRKRSELPEKFRASEAKLNARFAEYRKRALTEAKGAEEYTERRTDEIRVEREKIPGKLRIDQGKIEAEQFALVRRAVESIKRRVDDRSLPLPPGYSELLKVRGILNDYQERYAVAKRFTEARKSLISRAYKAWYRT